MHANHLINETSPYLLQHAHNPVNWYPWGNESLTLAKNENKIILLSIGYAACHWCHVMEKESFENEETAKLMNENFINIKIDREERPDLDSIYMDVVQTITGSGGWPLHVFLTPHQKPFFGGTYFPPKRLYGRLSWKEVLQNIIKAFKEKKDEIESQAEQLTQHLFTANNFLTNQNISNAGFDFFTTEALNTITKNILQQADVLDGGFGNAPKFPQTLLLQFLLRQFHNTQDKDALNHVLLSLNKMINGGIYDHIGGGFARYSTDAQWLAPHFEKMLYDNALMIIILSEAYQLTANHLFKEIIEQTLAFIEREMLQENGGFYCALDADSEGEEGKYYTWSKEEVEQILQQNATIFCSFYDITKNGNWE
ncbi:MAG: thioredoxin domain-containing protein, partial [Chitinophagaceae bacterium]|nr:thioredoxin domain-containing protein [Chitinophagaceae bacterium]